MIGLCGLGTHTYRAGCEDAHGLRAGALIAVPGGRCAEGRPIVATIDDDQVERLETLLVRLVAVLEEHVEAKWDEFLRDHPELEDDDA